MTLKVQNHAYGDFRDLYQPQTACGKLVPISILFGFVHSGNSMRKISIHYVCIWVVTIVTNQIGYFHLLKADVCFHWDFT